MRRNIMAVSFAALCLSTPVTTPAAAKPVAGTAANDAALEGQVLAALARELGPALDGLTVEVRNGVVTLGGSVADAGTRQRAERAAAAVTGVVRVSAAFSTTSAG